jgi:hypothetical protein
MVPLPPIASILLISPVSFCGIEMVTSIIGGAVKSMLRYNIDNHVLKVTFMCENNNNAPLS